MVLMFYVCLALVGGLLAIEFNISSTFLVWAAATILVIGIDHKHGVAVYDTMIHAFFAFTAIELGYLAGAVVMSRLMSRKKDIDPPS